MKSWYELNKNERKELESEFNNYRKKSKLCLVFYSNSIIFGILFFVMYMAKTNNICLEGSLCDIHTYDFGIGFVILFSVGLIINIITTIDYDKAFASWLEVSKKN